MWDWLKPKPKPDSEGTTARKKAQEDLDEVKGQWHAVREVSDSLNRMRRQNNFGKAIENIMRGEAK